MKCTIFTWNRSIECKNSTNEAFCFVIDGGMSKDYWSRCRCRCRCFACQKIIMIRLDILFEAKSYHTIEIDFNYTDAIEDIFPFIWIGSLKIIGNRLTFKNEANIPIKFQSKRIFVLVVFMSTETMIKYRHVLSWAIPVVTRNSQLFMNWRKKNNTKKGI